MEIIGWVGIGFCGLLGIAYVALMYFLPFYILYRIIKAIIRFARTGKPPWRRDEPARRPDEPATLKEALSRAQAAKAQAAQAAAAGAVRAEAAIAAGGESAAARAARAGEEVRLAEALLKRKRDELAAAMKEQGKLDRLALVYYVEASLRGGCTAAAVADALRAKGWKDADIDAAFQACGAEAAAA